MPRTPIFDLWRVFTSGRRYDRGAMVQRSYNKLNRGPVLHAPVVVALWLFVSPALACSLVDVAAARAEAVEIAGYHFLAACTFAAASAGVDLYQRRWSIVSLVALALVAFHPYWTMRPFYNTACQFLNVQASQAVLLVLAALMTFRLLRLVRRSRTRRVAS